MTKQEAISKMQALRAQGLNAKAYCCRGVYTAPGVGIKTFCNYFVRTSGTLAAAAAAASAS